MRVRFGDGLNQTVFSLSARLVAASLFCVPLNANAEAEQSSKIEDAMSLASAIGRVEAVGERCAVPARQYSRTVEKARNALGTVYERAALQKRFIASDIEAGHRQIYDMAKSGRQPDCDAFPKRVSNLKFRTHRSLEISLSK